METLGAAGSNTTNEDVDEGRESLLKIFEEGLNLFNNLGKIDEPTNSPQVQIKINKSIKLFENATRLVSLAGIFSTNEDVEEIPTENLRYLLLPALLGSLCLKLTTGNRKEITEVSEIYFKDFLQRCGDYGLTNYKIVNVDSAVATVETVSEKKASEMEKIKYSINTRANKIQKFKEQKELREKLKVLKQNMDNENIDEEVKRNYFLTMIRLFIYEAIDELDSIEAEKQILQHMATLNQDDKPKLKRPPVQPLKPIIITKDTVQKAVFGAGYPSLPVMSIEEFYDKRVQEGIFPGPATAQQNPISLQNIASADAESRNDEEDISKEEQLENDDPETIERMRQQDEFKDDHRRGWGNRMDRS